MMVVWLAVACGNDTDLPDKYSAVPIEKTEIWADDVESKTEETDIQSEESPVDQKEENDVSATVDREGNVTEEFSVIDSQGMTMESRIKTPEGYERPEAEGESLLEFLRQYPVKEDGSPGHVVMVVDVCENELGERAFLLAQGYMPAQEFHVLKNPASDTDPWYYEKEITYPFVTPEYVFEEGSLQRLSY